MTDEEILAFCREYFNYEPSTGVFTLLKHRGSGERHKPGDTLGTIDKRDGYAGIKIKGRRIGLHRLAWLMTHGEFPVVIDHIDGVRTNNAISNLRGVSVKENARNRRRALGNQSGCTGVQWVPRDETWQVTIGQDSGKIYLGTYKDYGMAVHMRKAAEEYLGYHENHGN